MAGNKKDVKTPVAETAVEFSAACTFAGEEKNVGDKLKVTKDQAESLKEKKLVL